VAAVLAIIVPSLAVVVSAVITVLGQKATRGKIEAVHQEVKTGNDKTLGGLGALTEGRRIRDQVPAADQSSDQKHYVELVEKDDLPGA